MDISQGEAIAASGAALFIEMAKIVVNVVVKEHNNRKMKKLEK